jgi:hypothetical protein
LARLGGRGRETLLKANALQWIGNLSKGFLTEWNGSGIRGLVWEKLPGGFHSTWSGGLLSSLILLSVESRKLLAVIPNPFLDTSTSSDLGRD